MDSETKSESQAQWSALDIEIKSQVIMAHLRKIESVSFEDFKKILDLTDPLIVTTKSTIDQQLKTTYRIHTNDVARVQDYIVKYL